MHDPNQTDIDCRVQVSPLRRFETADFTDSMILKPGLSIHKKENESTPTAGLREFEMRHGEFKHDGKEGLTLEPPGTLGSPEQKRRY